MSNSGKESSLASILNTLTTALDSTRAPLLPRSRVAYTITMLIPTGTCSMTVLGREMGSSALDTRACFGHNNAASTPRSLQATDQASQTCNAPYPERRPCQSALKFTRGLDMIPALR